MCVGLIYYYIGLGLPVVHIHVPYTHSESLCIHYCRNLYTTCSITVHNVVCTKKIVHHFVVYAHGAVLIAFRFLATINAICPSAGSPPKQRMAVTEDQ